ncbi:MULTISPECIES: glycine cleavage system protein GcvH [unclassified Thioalkalivibrio]|uniref:glycine cleavage system protein GcvH n=1 Tax=unclassified Thioalkalivibrio TaxID=2621013 RepID=UPI00036BADD4|nr:MULTISPECIES: glycine cleavage system protein GcvH [unclassified Thioalkalivibrio]
MSVPPDSCLFHEDHLWCLPSDDGTLLVGISDHAQDKLGDVLYLDLPEVGSQVECGVPMGTVESVKVVNDLICPVSGVITARNDDLEDQPELANSEPYGSGWLVRIRPASADATVGLMDVDTYQRHVDD